MRISIKNIAITLGVAAGAAAAAVLTTKKAAPQLAKKLIPASEKVSESVSNANEEKEQDILYV